MSTTTRQVRSKWTIPSVRPRRTEYRPRRTEYRPRRLREHPAFRELLRETVVETKRLIAPLFVSAGLSRPSRSSSRSSRSSGKREAISSMPGVFRLGIPEAVAEVKVLSKLGIGGVLLFGIPDSKDSKGTSAFDPDGVIQQALYAIKKTVPDLPVITDVCLCEYTPHGHCGILNRTGVVDNDATLPVLSDVALSHARAGADMVAPSAMMDGQVRAIRTKLDASGFGQVPILSYAAKYASAFYGPFREAVASSPRSGDRRGYQMDPSNMQEALREVALDIEEGADLVMIKPVMAYLDVLKTIKETFHWPTVAYQVSGEYALIKAAVARGWLEEKRLVLELITAIRRAGADLIITYYAKDLARWLKEKES